MDAQQKESSSKTGNSFSSIPTTTLLHPLSTMPLYTPQTCLFCPHPSLSIDSNLQHMSKLHNFLIPDRDNLIDVSTFLNFLNTVISEFHECLFCGTAKSNRWAAQDHMKSKGHCRIDRDGEWEEWGEFWEYASDADGRDEEEGAGKRVEEQAKLYLNSGKTLGHRSQARYFHRNASRTPLAAPSPSRHLHSNRTLDATASPTSAALSIYSGTSTSLVGVPELEQRALRATEKRTIQVAIRARNRYQSAVDKGGNAQKFFKNDVPGPKNG